MKKIIAILTPIFLLASITAKAEVGMGITGALHSFEASGTETTRNNLQKNTVAWMEGFGVPEFLLGPAIALEIIFPILIIIGYQTQLSAIILAIFSIATAVIFHLDFGNQMQTIAFLKNFALAGGFLFIAVNGPKEWSFDGKKKKYVRM